MPGGKRPKEKGDRAERKVVALLRESGFTAQRVPLSGMMGGYFGGDVAVLGVVPTPWRLEVKARKDGFKELYRWIGGDCDSVVVMADNHPPLVVMVWDQFEETLRLWREKYGHDIKTTDVPTTVEWDIPDGPAPGT